MSGPITLTVVVGRLDRGGTELHLLRVLPALAAHGIAVVVYALQGPGTLTPQFRAAGVVVIEGSARRGAAALLAAAGGLFVHLLRRRPAILHCFLPAAYIIGTLCALPVPGIRCVMSRRSLNRYQAHHPGIARLEAWLHRRMRAVLGNSRAVVAELLGEGVALEHLGLIRNGIAIPAQPDDAARAAARQALGLPQNSVIGITLANLIPYKGHADLLHALAAVAAQDACDWQWLCVGRDDGIGADLQATATRLGIGDRMRWVGAVADPEPYLRAADLAVSASHEEGFSNAVLEAMAMALPCVVTDVGGNPEAVEAGVCGAVVPARDAQALAAAILALAQDSALRRRQGAAARARVLALHGLPACIEAYVALYRALASDAARPIPQSARVGLGDAGHPDING